MMATSNVKVPCPKCEEVHRLYREVLESKRTILIKFHKQQELVRKLYKEIESIKRKTNQNTETNRTEESASNAMKSNETSKTRTKDPELERRLNEAMAVNKQWKEEYEQLKEKYNTDLRKFQEEVSSLNHKLEEYNVHILTLESENLRLAQALSGVDTSARTNESDQEKELVKFQMQAYKDDFSQERRDREKAQSEKESLGEELKSAQEIISTLMEEIEMYKTQHNRDQEHIRQIISQQSLIQPQLQIVYPVVDPSQHQQQTQWRQQQQKKGILSRGSHIAPPSAFYGGDVEVDQEDGPTDKPVGDGYRTI